MAGTQWWKERRETRWIGLALLVVCALLAGEAVAGIDDDIQAGIDGIDSTWSGAIAVLALVLGLAQGLRDSSRERQALLSHRPIPPARIAAAKLATGWCVVLLAAGLPLAAAAWWHRWHLPWPFLPQMLLMPALAIVAGLGCHAAGLYAGARAGTWYGARAALPLTALAVSLLADPDVDQATWFDMGMRISVVTGTALVAAAAAWGAIQSGGDVERVPRPLRWTAPLVTAGLAASLLVLALRTAMPWCWRDGWYMSYEFTPDGGVAVARTDTGDRRREARPLDASRPDDLAAASAAERGEAWTFRDADGFWRERDPAPQFDTRISRTRRDGVGGAYGCAVLIVEATGEVRLLAQRDGRALTAPVRPGDPPFPSRATRHSEDSQEERLTLVGEDGRLWWWDISEPRPRTVQGAWTAGQPLAWSWRDTDDGARLRVVTADGTQVYDTDGREVDRVAVPFRLDGLAFAEYQRMPDGGIMARSRVGGPRETPRLLRRFDRDGRLVFERELPILPPHSDGEPSAAGLMVQALVPPVATWALDRAIEYRGERYLRMHYESARMLSPWMSLPAAVLGALGALVLARRRGLALRHAAPWVALSLLFSFAGLSAAWLHAPAEERASCPSCGRLRPLARTTCPSCGAGWIRPSADGTEVMEPAA